MDGATDPAGQITQLFHQTSGLLDSLLDAQSGRHQYSYSADGRLSADAGPAGLVQSLARVQGDTGWTVTITTDMARATQYRTDLLSNGTWRRELTDPAGFTTVSLEHSDQLTTTTLPDGTITRITQSTDPRFGMMAPFVTRAVVRLPSGDSSVVEAARYAELADSLNPFSVTTLRDTVRVAGQAFVTVDQPSGSGTRLSTTSSPVGRQTIVRTDSLGRVVMARGSSWLWQSQLAPVAELDGNGDVVSRFVYATRVNVPDYMVKGDSTYRLVLDQLGSVRLVVNTDDGSVAQRIDYDEFGRVTLNTNPGFQPFGFAGGLCESGTGFVRFGARDYDPQTGRWTAKDPIDFAAGDASLYGYVGNDPLAYTDEEGLCPWCITGGVGAVVGGSSELIAQLLQNNGNWACLDWSKIAWEALKSGAISALIGAAGPRGPLFGRPGTWGRGAGKRPGLFNGGGPFGNKFRFGWSYNAKTGWQEFGAHGGLPRTPSHWHSGIPIFKGPTGWW